MASDAGDDSRTVCLLWLGMRPVLIRPCGGAWIERLRFEPAAMLLANGLEVEETSVEAEVRTAFAVEELEWRQSRIAG